LTILQEIGVVLDFVHDLHDIGVIVKMLHWEEDIVDLIKFPEAIQDIQSCLEAELISVHTRKLQHVMHFLSQSTR
jgi:hypothetical protein